MYHTKPKLTILSFWMVWIGFTPHQTIFIGLAWKLEQSIHTMNTPTNRIWKDLRKQLSRSLSYERLQIQNCNDWKKKSTTGIEFESGWMYYLFKMVSSELCSWYLCCKATFHVLYMPHSSRLIMIFVIRNKTSPLILLVT